jgi:hypothetical protein
MSKSIWILPFLFIACTSKPTFQPEVGGEGGKYAPGGVVYSIPAKNPVIKMKLVSVVIPQKTMLRVRMYFLRSGSPAGEYLDPQEQSISLPDSATAIRPTRVHAPAAGKPLIQLAENQKQSVELEFPLPPGGRHEYPYIQLNWKIHYRQNGQNLAMAETERFDYVHKVPAAQGVGQYEGDLEFPYADYYMPLPDQWMAPGLMWW